ncbi:MAG TPA: hypothetical protein VEI95_16145 [Acidobacteriota bacterium]|nr:hypothetical protein [Acidobacteriota bacterium]
MTVWRRTGLKLAIFILASLVFIAIAFSVIFRSDQFRIWLQTEIARSSGYEVHLAALDFQWPFTFVGHRVEVAKPRQFELTTTRLAATVTPFDLWSKTIHRLEIDQPVLQLDIDAIMKMQVQGSAQIALRTLSVQGGTIVIKKSAQTIFALPKINISAQNLNLGAQSGISLRADVPQLNGEAELVLKGQLRDLESELSIRPKRSSGLFGSGAQDATGELLHLRVKLRAPEQQSIRADISGNYSRLTLGDNQLTGTLNTNVAIDPGFTEAKFSGNAALIEVTGSVSSAPITFPRGPMTADATGNFSIPKRLLTVENLRLSSPLGSGTGEGKILFGAEPKVSSGKLAFRDLPLENFKAYLPAPFNHWSYQGQAQVALELQGGWDALAVKGTAQSDAMQIHGDELRVGKMSITAPFEWVKPTLRLKQNQIRAEKIAYSTKDRWQAAAEKLQIDGSFDYQANQPLKLTGHLDTTGAKFNSPDNAKVGENLNLSGPFELATDKGKESTSLRGKFIVDSGELLWGKFFADLKSQRPMLELDADYVRGQDRLDCRQCNLNLAHIGVVEVGGAIERLSEIPVLRLVATSRDFSPAGFFEFFLRETFNRQYPVLDKLTLAGQLAFRLRLDGQLDAIGAEGELTLKGGELRAKSNDWGIGPMALDLPLQIHLAQAKSPASGTARTGTVTIERIHFANQTIAPITASLSLTNNALRILQPLHIGIFGGDLEIHNLYWPDLLRNPTQVAFAAEAKQLRLDDLTQAMDWPRFSGILTGSIPEVQSAENTLRTRGEIQAELFGGHVRIGKLEIENPFSPLASIKLDANIDSIDLEQLSKTFAFGRISGVLEGNIENLVLTHGQPSELRADLHTVDRGGEQRISVEALNKITVLSSGEEAGALYGGLASFFDSFRYSKLGLKATLKNDRLTLRGVESHGDQEYLVVGSLLPPTVNVVSHTQNIAFSELLRRLDRINKSDKPNVK